MIQPGYFVYQLTITLAATLNIQDEKSLQIDQGLDFKVCSIQSIQTGNWSVIWGRPTVDFLSNFCRYSNVFGTAILKNQFEDPPIFQNGSVIRFKFRNDTSSSNSIELAVEGVHGKYF